MQNEFIKKGVIAEEQTGATVKTAADELVAAVKPKCKCNCRKCPCKQNGGKHDVTHGK